MSDIKSSFQFLSYKIDLINFKMTQAIVFLAIQGQIRPESLNIQVQIRQPQFDKSHNLYVGGLNIRVQLPMAHNSKPGDQTIQPPDKVFELEVGIAGLFQTEDRFEKEIEDRLVKEQIPAILFPYARSAITNILANAGFGSIIIPLINIHQLAENTLKDVQIAIIE